MFHHVGLLWTIETREKYKLSIEDHFIERCTVGPWFNQTMFRNLHGPIFEELFVTERQGRYNLMCGLYAHGKKNDR